MLPLADYLRGVAWEGDAATPYPRADPADAARLPGDTWATAQLPVGVRLELIGEARTLELEYICATDDLGYRGEGAGTAFSAWRGGREVATAPALLEGGTAVLELEPEVDAAGVLTVYLPEGMRPTVFGLAVTGGELTPAPRGPRWLAYGDSITEGWVASGPAGAWPAIAARRFGLDAVNLGYAGAARGEIASAEQIAGLPADVISIAYGTNCWNRTPTSAGQLREGLDAFLTIVRQGHPATPVVVASPIVRPDAEHIANRLGASLGDLRAAVEDVVAERQRRDPLLTLVPGAGLLTAAHLADGIHPGDDGHAILADAIGGAVHAAVTRGP